MNLTIKDLTTRTELDRAAMSAVRGGTDANSLVQNLLQAQSVLVPVANGASFGPGSATNIIVDVGADQSGSQSAHQTNGDKFSFALGLARSLG
jgi:hypothetical protein